MSDKKPNIVIIGGNGKFGSWFVRFFKKLEIPVRPLGRSDEKIWQSEVSGADIVIVSVPISQTSAVIKKVRDHVQKGALLCDFTSIKGFALKEMLKSKSKCGVTGIHPMFGPLATSLRNQSIVFCSGRDNQWTKFLKKLFKENGANIIESTPKEHDEKMAVVQALTHFVNVLFASIIKKQEPDKLNSYSSPVFRMQNILCSRVLGGKADLYADIAIHNPAFRKTLAAFDKEYRKLSKSIRNANHSDYEKIYNESAKALSKSIPIAQAVSTELFNLIDRYPVHIEKENGTAKMTRNLNRAVYALGPEGTFSHRAAINVFGEKADIRFSGTIREVFENVLNTERGVLGIVPIENSTQGIVQESLDCFTKFPIATVGSYIMPIHLCLFGHTKNIDEIKTIRSHPQPLAQAKEWIRINLPDALLETTSSSAKAILDTQDPTVAFIGSIDAAKQYGLSILAKNIEDKKNNATEFYVISKSEDAELSEKLGAGKTGLVLIVHDRPGVLRDILDAFSKRGINLTKLHSKSSDLEDYDYYFFLEVEGLPENPALQEALREIDSFCYIKRVLGKI